MVLVCVLFKECLCGGGTLLLYYAFWYGEAMKKLPRLVEATRMLVCAEDLGMVPDCVPWVINQLRILSLEIQTMPKDVEREV